MKQRLRRQLLGSAFFLLATQGPALSDANLTLPTAGTFETYRVGVRTWKDMPFRTVVRQEYDYSCGSASLATLLKFHYGMPVTEEEIFQDMYARGDKSAIQRVGFSLLDIKKYVERRGYSADGYRTTLEELEHSDLPSIAVILLGRYRHFVVIKGVRDGRVLVGDPALGLKVYKEEDFKKMWNGIIFVIREKPGQAAAFNADADWQSWLRAPLGERLRESTLGNVTVKIPIIYQIVQATALTRPNP